MTRTVPHILQTLLAFTLMAMANAIHAQVPAQTLTSTPTRAELKVPQPVLPPVGQALPNSSLPLHQPIPSPVPDASLPLPPTGVPLDADALIVRQGSYLARVGDCIACHTAPGGKPFGGGLAIDSPIGKIYSSNITPDAQHGIGGWTYEEFARLMREGIKPDGQTVYPAMPYSAYSRVSDQDMRALYAYLMKGVQPVAQANRDNDIPWPLSMRWPLGLWRVIFAPTPKPYTPSTDGSGTQLLRGAYLVEGLGHCGSCHTARSFTLQEKALTSQDGTAYLAGGQVIDGWYVPSLRNEHGGGLAGWSQDDILEFMKTGRNAHSASFGAMNDVIHKSTQYFNDADQMAIASFLKSLGPHSDATPYQYDPKVAQQLFDGQITAPGALTYLNRCAACHRSNGTGNGKAFPALAGNAMLQTQIPTSAIHVILAGGAQPYTDRAPSTLTMAPYADILSDQEIADLVTFIQQSWGNQGGPATAQQVAQMRKIAMPVQAAPPVGVR